MSNRIKRYLLDNHGVNLSWTRVNGLIVKSPAWAVHFPTVADLLIDSIEKYKFSTRGLQLREKPLLEAKYGENLM